MSLALSFSSLISSFNAFSWNLVCSSSSFTFCFWICNFSFSFFSISSSCLLLFSSAFKVLYSNILLAILSKKAWIYFSKLKLILKLNSGFKEFWSSTTLDIMVAFFLVLTFLFFLFVFIFLLIFFLLLIFFFYFWIFFLLFIYNFFNLFFC